MPTYKGIGYDSSGKLRTGTASDDIEFDAQITATDGIAVTGDASVSGEIQGASLDISGDASVTGNLTVTGDIVSGGSSNLVIKDPAIDLGIGATGAQSTGFSFVANKGTNFNSISSITESTRVVVVTGTVNIATNDIVSISGADDAGNDGLYVVSGVSGQNITLGNTSYVGTAPFIQTALSSDQATANGEIAQVDLKALIVAGDGLVSDGASNYAEGTLLEAFAADAVISDFNAAGSYQPVGSSATVTLQDAYNSGNTITLTNTNNLDINKPSSGTASISLEANLASDFTVDGANLSLQTSTSGNVILSSAGVVQVSSGALDIDTSVDADVTTFAVDSSSATTITSSQASTSAIVLNASNASGDVRIQNAGSDVVQIDGAGGGVTGNWDISGNLGVNGNTTLGDATSDTVTFTARAASSLLPDTDVTYDLGSQALSWSAVYTNDAFVGNALTLVNGAQDSILFVGASGEVIEDNANLRYDGSSFEIGAAVSPVFGVTVSNGNTDVGGTLNVVGAASLDGGITVDTTAFIVADTTGNVTTAGTLDVAGLASLDGGIDVDGAFTVADTTGNISTTGTLNVDSTSTLGDDVTLDKAGAQSIQKAAASAGQDLQISLTGANDSSIKINSAGTGNDAISLVASAGDMALETEATGKSLTITSDFPHFARGFSTETSIASGDALYMTTNGGGDILVSPANATVASTSQFLVVALEAASGSGGSPASLNTAMNGIVTMNTNATSWSSATHAGKPVYLDTNAGKITPTAPSSSGNVVFQIGIGVGGSGTAWQVLLQPQFIMEIG